MNIIEFIITAVIAICIAFFIVWKIYKQGLRKTVINLIVEVETKLKSNQEKFDTVVNGILIRLPFPFNIIPSSIISEFVQKTFDEVKIALNYREEK